MQSRLMSMVETVSNIAVGFVIALLSQLFIFHFYGVNMPIEHNVQITAWFTLVSVIRSYALRRVFNRIKR